MADNFLCRWTDLSMRELADRCLAAGLAEIAAGYKRLSLMGVEVLRHSHRRWVLLPLERPPVIDEERWATFMQVIKEVTAGTPCLGASPVT